jgi:type I restriction enzyme S subunit
MSFDMRSVVTERAISKVGLQRFSRAILPRNTVCVVCIGATIGKICMTDGPTLTNQQLNSVICDSNVADPYFLYYSLRLKHEELVAKATGAATPILNKSAFEQIEIDVPPLDIQRRIAGILSAYDDLIGANARRISILEAMARRIFEEWFVEGSHAITKQLGSTPLASVLSHTIGGTWGADTRENDSDIEANVIRGTDMPNWKAGLVDRIPTRFIPERTMASRKLVAGDVIVEVSGGSKDQPVGRTILFSSRMKSLLLKNTTFASFCRLARPNIELIAPETLFLFFDWLYRTGRVLEYQTQSTGISNLKFSLMIEREQIHTLAADDRSAFERVVKPLLKLIDVLAAQCSHLRAARDHLLPKLISGEIDLARAGNGIETGAKRAVFE